MKKSWLIILLALVMVLAAGCGSTASTPSGEGTQSDASAETGSKFPEKDIRLIVSYPAGGGFDKLARQIAPYIEKNLPNDVMVIVENKPGGNSVMGINEVLNAKPDGYTIGIFNLPGHLVGQIATGQYDLSKLAWLGQAVVDPQVAVASKNSGLTSLEDVVKAGKVKVSASGLTGTDGLGAIASSAKMGFEVNLLTPGGANEAMLSLMRGDADLSLQPFASAKPLIDAKEVVPIWVFANERLPELPDVPTIVEKGFDNPGLISINNLRRAFATSGQVGEEEVTILRDAFKKALEDPELQAEIAKGGTPITYASPEELEQAMKDMIESITPFTEQLKAASGN